MSIMVFQFDTPHRIGTVCHFPCSQCGDKDIATLELTDAHANAIPPTPLYIVAEATADDWSRSVVENGGTSEYPLYQYFYFVTTD